ncbi:MAG: hypothetical protein AAGA56_04875, partial [Myxococcota bacterium]
MRFRTARTWLTFLASVFVGAPALAQPAPVESATNGRDTGTTEVAQAGPGPSPAASAAATSAPAPTVAQAGDLLLIPNAAVRPHHTTERIGNSGIRLTHHGAAP